MIMSSWFSRYVLLESLRLPLAFWVRGRRPWPLAALALVLGAGGLQIWGQKAVCSKEPRFGSWKTRYCTILYCSRLYCPILKHVFLVMLRLMINPFFLLIKVPLVMKTSWRKSKIF